ncbi:MAG: hypothetical protein MZW92_69000 [Comamonadaceae bacterium]|nr:hypothetical protein [Comamonadaceae bacterium]
MATIEFTAFPRTDRRPRRVASHPPRRQGARHRLRRQGRRRRRSSSTTTRSSTRCSNEAFHASILTMELDGKSEQGAAARRARCTRSRAQVLHVDFQRVDEDQQDPHEGAAALRRTRTISPAVKLGGAIVSHVTTELDVACLPKDLPEFIEVDLSDARSRQAGARAADAQAARRRRRR